MQFFPSLKELIVASNNFTTPLSALQVPSLRTISLTNNPLGNLEKIAALSLLPTLTSLSMRSCSITHLPNLKDPFKNLTHLDLSANNIPSMNELNSIPASFPSLQSLRVSSNPFYTAIGIDEAHMLTLARIPSLTMLNYSKITEKERENAELYYISKIKAELEHAITSASVADSDTPELTAPALLKNHPLYEMLCEKYDQSTAITTQPVTVFEDPYSLAARLVKLTCLVTSSKNKSSETEEKTILKSVNLTLPRTVNIYRLKSLVGAELSLLPSHFTLIWETGELDPVAKNIALPGRPGQSTAILDAESDTDDKIEEAAEAAEAESSKEKIEVDDTAEYLSKGRGHTVDFDKSRWVRREVELIDSTRPLSYWIESREATLRVET
jgi:tubulin-specific chaperone E